MKKIMKKVLSLALVIALAIAPMTVMAAPGSYLDPISGAGTAVDPYIITADEAVYKITIDASATVYVMVQDEFNATITGLAGFMGGFSMRASLVEMPTESDGNTEINLALANNNMFMVSNAVAETNTVLLKAATGGGSGVPTGTIDNPKQVTLADQYGMGFLSAFEYTPLEAGNQGYYYTVTAPDDGAILVSVSASDDAYNDVGWFYYVNNMTASKYGDYHWSDDAEPVYTETCPVSAGDEVVVFAATYDPNNMWNNPAGNLAVNFSFANVGSYEYPVEITTMGDYEAPITANSQGYNYVYKATESGTLTVTMSDTNANGWQYFVNNLTSYTYGDTYTYADNPVVDSYDVAVSAGDEVTIMVSTFDSSNPYAAPPVGTVDWTISFVAGSGNPGGGNPGGGNPGGGNPGGGDLGGNEDNYEVSSTVLQLGDNAVTLSNMYEWTLFEFTPDETGEYKFQTDDGVIGYWGAGTFFLTEPDDTTLEGNVTHEITAAGQTIVVGVKDVLDGNTCNILVTRVGDAQGGQDIPVNVYENKVKPSKQNLNLDANKLEGVDVWDDTKDKAVLGKDGYYHLNTEDGPVLFVNLTDSILKLADLANYGAKEGVYDNGVVVSMNDYTQAILDYVACAAQLNDDFTVYPLTEDLMTFYQKLGAYKYWYEADPIMGSDPVVQDAKYPQDEAWMFACYYQDGLNTLGNSGAVAPGGAQEAPKTGDNANVAVWAIVMVVAAGAAFVVAESKRRAR